jgi:hypothetical protein
MILFYRINDLTLYPYPAPAPLPKQECKSRLRVGAQTTFAVGQPKTESRKLVGAACGFLSPIPLVLTLRAKQPYPHL